VERRASPEFRLYPDAATMHFDDLLGNCQSKPRAPFCLGVGAVYLLELLEDASLLSDSNPGSRVADMNRELIIL
jgi:hypothetical protein